MPLSAPECSFWIRESFERIRKLIFSVVMLSPTTGGRSIPTSKVSQISLLGFFAFAQTNKSALKVFNLRMNTYFPQTKCSLRTKECSFPTKKCSLPVRKSSFLASKCLLPTEEGSVPTGKCLSQARKCLFRQGTADLQ